MIKELATIPGLIVVFVAVDVRARMTKDKH
jgi:hypothetical protein